MKITFLNLKYLFGIYYDLVKGFRTKLNFIFYINLQPLKRFECTLFYFTSGYLKKFIVEFVPFNQKFRSFKKNNTL